MDGHPVKTVRIKSKHHTCRDLRQRHTYVHMYVLAQSENSRFVIYMYWWGGPMHVYSGCWDCCLKLMPLKRATSFTLLPEPAKFLYCSGKTNNTAMICWKKYYENMHNYWVNNWLWVHYSRVIYCNHKQPVQLIFLWAFLVNHMIILKQHIGIFIYGDPVSHIYTE